MKKFTVLTIIGLSFLIALASAACSSSGADTAPSANTAMVNKKATNSAANHGGTISGSEDEIPAVVKAAFPEAQSFTKQHKDVPASAIASIEKDTSGKVPDKDHHSYLAFTTKDGKRTQIGAATVVKADGKDLNIVYESKGGMPTIRDIRADGVPAGFLKQFAGKNHDTKIKFGEDIKALGVSEETAKAIAQAVRIDVLTMEALYGAAHSH